MTQITQTRENIRTLYRLLKQQLYIMRQLKAQKKRNMSRHGKRHDKLLRQRDGKT